MYADKYSFFTQLMQKLLLKYSNSAFFFISFKRKWMQHIIYVIKHGIIYLSLLKFF